MFDLLIAYLVAAWPVVVVIAVLLAVFCWTLCRVGAKADRAMSTMNVDYDTEHAEWANYPRAVKR